VNVSVQKLDCEEVDIGVGTMKGNYHCNFCGWVEEELEPGGPRRESGKVIEG